MACFPRTHRGATARGALRPQGWTLLYWEVGRPIRTKVLQEQRADYGERIVRMLSRSCFRQRELGERFSGPLSHLKPKGGGVSRQERTRRLLHHPMYCRHRIVGLMLFHPTGLALELLD